MLNSKHSCGYVSNSIQTFVIISVLYKGKCTMWCTFHQGKALHTFQTTCTCL